MQGDPTPVQTVTLTSVWDDRVGSCFHPPGQDTGVAMIGLVQISDEYFALIEGFRFRDARRGSDRVTDRVVDIEPGDLLHNRTDLTSVPRALTWFVGRFGRHTPAALLHDALLDRVTGGPEPRLRGYEDADHAFLEALECLNVPPLRRVTMWAAVAFGTRSRVGGMATVAIWAWVIAFVVGTFVLGAGILHGNVVAAAAAFLMPFLGALLWGRQYRAGLVASYAAVFVAAPTLLGAITYAVYRGAEWFAKLVVPSARTTDEVPPTGF